MREKWTGFGTFIVQNTIQKWKGMNSSLYTTIWMKPQRNAEIKGGGNLNKVYAKQFCLCNIEMIKL